MYHPNTCCLNPPSLSILFLLLTTSSVELSGDGLLSPIAKVFCNIFVFSCAAAPNSSRLPSLCFVCVLIYRYIEIYNKFRVVMLVYYTADMISHTIFYSPYFYLSQAGVTAIRYQDTWYYKNNLLSAKKLFF